MEIRLMNQDAIEKDMSIIGYSTAIISSRMEMITNISISEITSRFNKTMESFKFIYYMSGISRYDSFMLNQLKLNYSIMSQRYNSESVSIDKFVDIKFGIGAVQQEFDKEAPILYQRIANFYNTYKNDVPAEDLRYVLPSNFKTNEMISFTGDKIIDVARIIKRSSNPDFYDAFIKTLKVKGIDIGVLVDTIVTKLEASRNMYEMTLYMNEKNVFNKRPWYEQVLINALQTPTINPCKLLSDDNNLYLSGVGARICKTAKSIDEILQEKTKSEFDDLAINLNKMGHSVAEHSYIRVLSEMSIAAFTQLTRHRICNNTILDMDDYVQYISKFETPKSIKQNDAINIEYIKLMIDLMEYAKRWNCPELIPLGTIIPSITVSNIRNEYHIANERLCNNAQWEVREYFEKRAKLIEKITNNKVHLVPKCINAGKCVEGKYTCKKFNEVKNKYLN